MNFTDIFGIKKHDVVSIVGCGGKTSLIGLLAKENSDRKVLVTTTTKIFPMSGENIFLCTTNDDVTKHLPQNGINCLGIIDSSTGKLSGIDERVLYDIAPNYDLTLIESDGSRGLPCKGWSDHEPVVVDFTSYTVGVVTFGGLGKAVTEENVLRIDEFIKLTDLNYSDTISIENIADMICKPEGMFKNSVGKKYLFINKIEDVNGIEFVAELERAIGENYVGLLDDIFYGSVKNKTIMRV